MKTYSFTLTLAGVDLLTPEMGDASSSPGAMTRLQAAGMGSFRSHLTASPRASGLPSTRRSKTSSGPAIRSPRLRSP